MKRIKSRRSRRSPKSGRPSTRGRCVHEPKPLEGHFVQHQEGQHGTFWKNDLQQEAGLPDHRAGPCGYQQQAGAWVSASPSDDRA